MAEPEDLPIGTPVRAWPGVLGQEPVLLTRTRNKPWALGSGDMVVSVEGYAGGIALTHIEVLDKLPFQCGPDCRHEGAPHLYAGAIDPDRCVHCAAYPSLPCALHREKVPS